MSVAARAAALRAEYEARVAERPPPPRREGVIHVARDTHDQRFERPWADPCDDPADLRELAAQVADAYAEEARLAGNPRAAYYVRAAAAWRAQMPR